MGKVIVDGQIVEDRWLYVEDASALPTQAQDIIVSLSRFQAEREALLERQRAGLGALGVSLGGEERPDGLLDDLGELALVRWVFSKFADGRGYSYAALLRGRHGFKGQLRAAGDVLRDQLFYLKRCGFNAFEVRQDKSLEDALLGLADFSVLYQPAADQPQAIYHRERPKPANA